MGIINDCADADRIEQVEQQRARNADDELHALQRYNALVREEGADSAAARDALYQLWEMRARQREIDSRMMWLHH